MSGASAGSGSGGGGGGSGAAGGPIPPLPPAPPAAPAPGAAGPTSYGDYFAIAANDPYNGDPTAVYQAETVEADAAGNRPAAGDHSGGSRRRSKSGCVSRVPDAGPRQDDPEVIRVLPVQPCAHLESG